MKIVNKITLGLVTATLLFVGCSQNATPAKKEVVKATISEDSLGLRKASLFNEAEIKPNGTEYSQNYAGSGHKIKRAFQDAPPMIPHDVTGLIPITIHDNQCLGCHMPEVAPSVGATPIPASHFMDFRPVTTLAADGEVEKMVILLKIPQVKSLKMFLSSLHMVNYMVVVITVHNVMLLRRLNL